MLNLKLQAGAGYDLDEVKGAIGPERFAGLGEFLSTRSVFSCGHATDDKGYEKHCIYASDLEAFLREEHHVS